MLALRLLPSGDGGQSPHVGHLLVVVEVLHQGIVEEMRLLGALPRPDDELCRIGEVSAGDVGRRIGLRPGDDVEDFEAELGELVGYGDTAYGCERSLGFPLSQLRIVSYLCYLIYSFKVLDATLRFVGKFTTLF